MQSYFNNKPFWSGSVNLNDGIIEEVHTIEEAQNVDYHHTFYFSESQIDKLKNEECGFFWIDNGIIYADWRNHLTQNIIDSIMQQIIIL